MPKSADAFRTIGEVSTELDVPKHVLRFWEAKFKQLRPMKRGGGRRFYRPEDVELLRGIKTLLHRDAYTIRGAQRVLRDQGVDWVKSLGDPAAAAAMPQQTPNPPEAATAASIGAAPTRTRRKPAAATRNSGRNAVISKAIAELAACRALLLGGEATTGSSRQRA